LTNRKHIGPKTEPWGTLSNRVETRSVVLDMQTLRWICKVILNQPSSLHKSNFAVSGGS